MPNLFGIDIQGILANALAATGGLVSGTLTHYEEAERDPDDPTLQTAPTSTEHTIQGFVNVAHRERLRGQEAVLYQRNEQIATIVGGSIVPFVEPAKGDVVTFDGKSYTLGDLRSSDPAQAVYEFVAD